MGMTNNETHKLQKCFEIPCNVFKNLISQATFQF